MRARGPWLFAVAVALLAVALGGRSCPGGPSPSGPEAVARAGRDDEATGRGAAPGAPPAEGLAPPPAPSPSPSAGWEAEAEAIATDLRRILAGRARGGAYAEARAAAARDDLALFPPPRDRVRRLLLGSERERTLALAALAARPDLDDDLLRIVLRSQRPEDDDVVRLLGAEIAAAAPADLAARHEEDLLRAFEAEPNPLVFAVALPALERMEEARLRSLLRSQLSAAAPGMAPVLVGLARDRLGAAAIDEVGAAPPGR